MDQHNARPGSVSDDKIRWVASDPLKSLGSRVTILPWVELDRADVCLVGDT